ncbi:MAG: plasmid mobilization relaxosome protein MobC [Chitinophagaceae bacterium]
MEPQKNGRARFIGLRLTMEEYSKLEKGWKASTCRKLSDYIRKILFNKPIVTRYRDQSMDDLMTEMIELKTELGRVGNNFNQAVRRLNGIDKIGEIRTWLITYEDDKNRLLQGVENIKTHVQKVAEKWLQ